VRVGAITAQTKQAVEPLVDTRRADRGFCDAFATSGRAPVHTDATVRPINLLGC
jgi:hypothetical protein